MGDEETAVSMTLLAWIRAGWDGNDNDEEDSGCVRFSRSDDDLASW